MKRVEIIWRDAEYTSFSEREYWAAIGDTAQMDENIYHAIGFVLKESEDLIRIAQNVQFDADGKPLEVGGIFTIPKGCIKNIRELPKASPSDDAVKAKTGIKAEK